MNDRASEQPSVGAAPIENLGARVRSLRLTEDLKSTSNLRSPVIPWVLCVLLTMLTGWLAYRQWAADGARRVSSEPIAVGTNSGRLKAPASAGQDAPLEPNLVSDRAENGSNAVVLESKGYIVPRNQVLVSPQVSGRIIRLDVEEGSRVEQGRVLAEVDPTEYRAESQRVNAMLDRARQELQELERGARPQELSQAEAELQENEIKLNQLEGEFGRLSQLRTRGLATESEFDVAESNFRSTVRRVERLRLALELLREGPRAERIAAARATVAQAEADQAKANWKLENCSIRAPISGTILKKNAEEGNLVNAIAFNGSFSICDIADLSDLEVELNIQERDVSRVFAGQRCSVRCEAYPKRSYEARVSRLMPIADRAKGAIPVRVKVVVPADEEGVYLKPEMSAIVTFFSSTVK
ncbi:MAG: efflux RND transporter periplasmic adaptor subunit [Planctomycetota bacterium]|nr:efflux RND transporter periplasmic adaptor subunit [Planctomycetota bacterium]MDA1177322.1 efflux RND transporter periplasmic adaptor subunit [Planctomycetota bacterium]